VHGPERELAFSRKRRCYCSRISREIEGRRKGRDAGNVARVFSRKRLAREFSSSRFSPHFCATRDGRKERERDQRPIGDRAGRRVKFHASRTLIERVAAQEFTRREAANYSSSPTHETDSLNRTSREPCFILLHFVLFHPSRAPARRVNARVRWMLVCFSCARKLFGCSPLESSRTSARTRARLKLHRGAQCMPNYVHLCRQQFAAIFRHDFA